MKGPILDVDAQRARWQAYRKRQALVLDVGKGFARGGLGSFVDSLDLRLLFLPSDPDADVVPLDERTLEWLKADRPSPYGGGPVRWGHQVRATSNALVAHDRYGDDRGWTRYLAFHRHGGLELGWGNLSYEICGLRVFSLRHVVGLAWSALALQEDANSRWSIAAPFELTVALCDTHGATLGGFAEGWREPGAGLAEPSVCIEDQVLLRWELDAELNVEQLAIDVGDRVEQAFGSTHRRHLAHRGEYEGRFDPRFGF